jgi:selenocysteine-specific elongation factor
VRRFVLGTAGHVDHGKTTLVRALTGVDTDRLPEEKKRGITIELGFAPWDLEGGMHVSVIDVPGHRRLVHTMIAGAAGMELVLLVVAADEVECCQQSF